MHKGFNQDDFMNWMEEKFGLNDYGRRVVLSIITYAHKYEHVGKDQFAEFVSDLLPEVEFLDVARFCGNEILTVRTLRKLGRF